LKNKRNTSKSEIKKLKNNATLVQTVSNRMKGGKKCGIMGKKFRLGKFSNCSMKNMETISNHSEISQKGRKGRLLSASSKSGINLKEFSQLKYENK